MVLVLYAKIVVKQQDVHEYRMFTIKIIIGFIAKYNSFTELKENHELLHVDDEKLKKSRFNIFFN